MAAGFWHGSRAKKALVQARRSRFPKSYERESRGPSAVCRNDHRPESRRRLITGPSAATVQSTANGFTAKGGLPTTIGHRNDPVSISERQSGLVSKVCPLSTVGSSQWDRSQLPGAKQRGPSTAILLQLPSLAWPAPVSAGWGTRSDCLYLRGVGRTGRLATLALVRCQYAGGSGGDRYDCPIAGGAS
jgi:hypothetical protein